MAIIRISGKVSGSHYHRSERVEDSWRKRSIILAPQDTRSYSKLLILMRHDVCRACHSKSAKKSIQPTPVVVSVSIRSSVGTTKTCHLVANGDITT